jgi:acetyl-CoA synthetase
LLHSFDVGSDDVVFWLTDLGWIMAAILVFGGLVRGSTIVLYEGAPDYPGPGRLWRLVEDHGVTIFGGSPSLARSLRRHGSGPVRARDLRSIRVIGSTGEPIDLDSWDWLFREVGGGRAPIINYSGGTEVGGGILGCFPVFAQRPCAFNRPFPGMDADVFDPDGRPIRGRIGELVVKLPWPGQARTFWGDHQRYVDTYWSRWPGVWVHGDVAMIDSVGDWYIVGRSDDTLNVAGNRVGPAELEALILAYNGIRDAVVVGLEDPLKGQVPAAFVVADDEPEWPDSLSQAINEYVVARLGPTSRLAGVWRVPDLPRTRNGKISRKAVREAFLGTDMAPDQTVLENPASLKHLTELGARYRMPTGKDDHEDLPS